MISSEDPAMSNCLDCQIREYASADVIVGLHGAGIVTMPTYESTITCESCRAGVTNVMFMKPHSVLIEIIGKFDGRMLPVCGYHGPLAAIYGVHHYLHYYDWKGDERFNPMKIAAESFDFYSYIQTIKPKQ